MSIKYVSADEAADEALRLIRVTLNRIWTDRLEGWLAKADYETEEIRPLFDGRAKEELYLAAVAIQLASVGAGMATETASEVRRAILAKVRAESEPAMHAVSAYSKLWHLPASPPGSAAIALGLRILERAGADRIIVRRAKSGRQDPALGVFLARLAAECGSVNALGALRVGVETTARPQAAAPVSNSQEPSAEPGVHAPSQMNRLVKPVIGAGLGALVVAILAGILTGNWLMLLIWCVPFAVVAGTVVAIAKLLDFQKMTDLTLMAAAAVIMTTLIAAAIVTGTFAYFTFIACSFFFASWYRPLFTEKWWWWFAYPAAAWSLAIYLLSH